MSVFVDTSAFIAIISPSDEKHQDAAKAWRLLLEAGEELVTSGHVLIETISLLHSRSGTEAVRRFVNAMVPAMKTVWLDQTSHDQAVILMLDSPGKSGPSLVDCVSFEVIRRCRIKDVFVYDRHFENRGFNIVGE